MKSLSSKITTGREKNQEQKFLTCKQVKSKLCDYENRGKKEEK